MKILLLLEQISQWLGVLGYTYGMKMISLSNHRILRTCITDLGWFQRRQKQTFSSSRRQLTSRCTWIKGSHSFHQTSTSWDSMKKMLSKVSNTNLMFNNIMEEIRMLSMGSTTTQQNFHITGLPPSCEHGDSIGQPQRYNGVCSRDQPRVRQHYEHRWFWLDLTIAHTQIKGLIRQ